MRLELVLVEERCKCEYACGLATVKDRSDSHVLSIKKGEGCLYLIDR